MGSMIGTLPRERTTITVERRKERYTVRMHLPVRFQARTVRGAGRGKDLDAPTMNLAMEHVPAELEFGVYAGRVFHEGEILPAAIHLGPAPVFGVGPTCEVHVIDTSIPTPPETLDVEFAAYLRPVMDFPSVDALKAQIANDIERARAIMAAS